MAGQNIPELINERIRTEQQKVYTVLPVVVQEVEYETRRMVVAHKDTMEILSDNIPIGTPYAGDGYGEIYPVAPGDEGFLLCSMYPMTELLKDRGFQRIKKQRFHSYDDAIFFPRIWWDPDEVPAHDPGDYLMYHESGTWIRIDEAGDYHIEHVDGHTVDVNSEMIEARHTADRVMRLNQQEAVLETNGGTRQLRADDNIVSARIRRNDGQDAQLIASENTVEIEIPDEKRTHASGDYVRLDVNDQGKITADGETVIGTKGAKRRTSVDPDAPETGTTATPIWNEQNATDVNPALAQFVGVADYQHYQPRNFRFEQREADPDPAVSDPTNPAYIELPASRTTVPPGYVWFNVAEGSLKIQPRGAGAPVEIIGGL